MAYCQDEPAETGKKKDKKEEKPGVGIGIKAGLNFANVTNASSINADTKSGYHIGVFLAPQSKGIMAYRTELIFSRQGYDFKNGTTSGTVDLNYLLFPQLMGINITKYVQLQFGFQMAFLLNAKADSTDASGEENPYSQVMDYYNKFDYGFSGGIELHPFKGLIVGARLNISLSELYKMPENGSGTPPSFFPSTDNINLKNNVLQLSLGYRF